MGIIIAIIIFGLIVTVHEFGHFICAKISGIRVLEFSIGMGPKIIQKKKGETMYSLRLLPVLEAFALWRKTAKLTMQEDSAMQSFGKE